MGGGKRGVHIKPFNPKDIEKGMIIEAEFSFIHGRRRYGGVGWGAVLSVHPGSITALFYNPKAKRNEKKTIHPGKVKRIVPMDEFNAALEKGLAMEDGS